MELPSTTRINTVSFEIHSPNGLSVFFSGGRLGGEKGTRKECQIRNAHLFHQLSQRSSRSSLELYTSQLHSGSMGLPQTDSISGQTPPPGGTNSKAREKIRALTVSKTLALSDIMLKLFHVSILRSSEWALSSIPTELANSQTAALKLFKKITGPFSGLVI